MARPSRNIRSRRHRALVRRLGATAVDRATEPAQPSRDLRSRRRDRSVGARERLQVGVAVRLGLLRALDVVDAPGDDAVERHRQGEERVRDAGIAPVEEQVAAVPDEDLSVVEIVVLDRLGEPVDGELVARLANPGTRRRSRRRSSSGFRDLDRAAPRPRGQARRAGSRERRARAARRRPPSGRSARLHRAGARRASG